jgi:hypothetical protein
LAHNVHTQTFFQRILMHFRNSPTKVSAQPAAGVIAEAAGDCARSARPCLFLPTFHGHRQITEE